MSISSLACIIFHCVTYSCLIYLSAFPYLIQSDGMASISDGRCEFSMTLLTDDLSASLGYASYPLGHPTYSLQCYPKGCIGETLV